MALSILREIGQNIKKALDFLSTEFWIGNEKLSHLTNQAVYELRVDMTLSNGSSFYSAYHGFRIADEWSQYKIVNMIALDSNVGKYAIAEKYVCFVERINYIVVIPAYQGTLISVCPSNMIYATCSCKATCEDPNGQSGYNCDCLGSEGCTCPAGFLMQGSDCILPSECGCFVTEINSVIPNRETYFNNDCTQKCSCSNNRLICQDNRCSTNAVCDVRDGVRKCYCIEGYEGDGYICESLSDCQDVYDAGHRQDGVYTILPTGWPVSPFSVYCKMENGGGWTVFQRRSGGSTSFNQNWDAYKEGFGDLNDDFWLGMRNFIILQTKQVTRCASMLLLQVDIRNMLLTPSFRLSLRVINTD
ncbi:Fibrinogen C domain-containing protein 1-A [Apostichopus japonicus]|uniref:Fibrinogen C domain-containing protein 1-A n=1 Tax=Stichopus japonicus TaxID=307972 RepID=A0A2G8LHI2_STIJA|nr:Fibrinogen C domain-containing protein 1-A [Apostichopus japonicus]